jgi:hypothetical protein
VQPATTIIYGRYTFRRRKMPILLITPRKGGKTAVPLSFGQFGSSGHRDDRRRRLLTEDHSASAGTAAAPAASSTSRTCAAPVHKTERYGDAEFLNEQRCLLDFVPQRLLVLVLLFFTGASVIAGLEAIYIWIPSLAAKTALPRLAALELGGKGSLATWFSSLMLLTAAVLATLVYTVRRHRIDDYHGRYRIWLWAAMCWFIMATDLSASLHEGFREAMVLLSGSRLWGDGSIWWLIAYGLLLGSIGSRLLIDMWPCRLSSSALALAAGCYAGALLVRFGLVSPGDAAHLVMFQQGAAMAGHLLILTAMALHARYVLLDAQGLVRPRPKKEKKVATTKAVAEKPATKDKNADSTEDKSAWIAVDSPHDARPPVLRRAAAAPATAKSVASPPAATATTPTPKPFASTISHAADNSADSKLSKADRKALKNRLLQERLQREKQKQGSWAK